MSNKESIIRTIFALDGETQYQEALKKLNKENKLLNSEMSKVNASYMLNGDKIQYSRDKIEVYNKQIELQKRRIEEAKHALEQSTKKFGEGSEKTQEYAKELNYAEAQLIRLESRLKKTTEELKIQTNALIQSGKSIIKTGEAWSEVGKKMGEVGRNLTMKVTAPILALGAASIKSAIDFESGMAGVRKTTNLTADELEIISQELRNISKEIPVSVVELTKLTEAAGQLGIEKENLVGFTRVIADLGVATNIASEEGAMSLARFANITQMSQKDFDRLGSSIVELGNNTATTEKEILDMAMKLAAAGHQAGMSEADILGISAALSALGLESQAGGSAFSKMINKMSLAVDIGSDELLDFAAVAGMSADKFSETWGTNAASALSSFIIGLGDFERHGMSANEVLDLLEIKEVRLVDSLLRTSGAQELFNDTLSMSNEAWIRNSALQEEAAIRYGTTESQLLIAKNRMNDVAIDLGNKLIPTLTKVMEFIVSLTEKFQKLSPGTQDAIVKLALFAAALGPIISISSKVVSGIGSITKSIGSLMVKAGQATATGGGLSGLLGMLSNPTTGIIAVAVLAAGAIYGIIKKLTEVDPAVKEARESVKEFGKVAREIESSYIGTVSMMDNYKNTLFNLLNIESKSSLEKERIAHVVAILNQLIPELNLQYDKQTDSINKTEAAVESLMKIEKERVLEAAKNKILEENAEALSSVYSNLAKQTADLNFFKETTIELERLNNEALKVGLTQQEINVRSASKIHSDKQKWSKEEADAINKITDFLDKQGKKANALFEDGEVHWFNLQSALNLADNKTKKLEKSTNQLKNSIIDLETTNEHHISGLDLLIELLGLTSEETNKLKENTEETFEKSSNAVGKYAIDYERNMLLIGKSREEALKAEEEYYNNTRKLTDDNLGLFSKFTTDKVDLSKISTTSFIKMLEDETDAFEKWQGNLKILSERGFGAVAAEIEKLGPEGSKLVGDFVNRTDDELSRLEEVYTRQIEAAAKVVEDQMERQEDLGKLLTEHFIIGMEKGYNLHKYRSQQVGKNIGKDLSDGARQSLKISSPSKVGVDIGENFVSSIGLGVEKETTGTIDRVIGLASDMSKAAHFGNLNFGGLYGLTKSKVIDPASNVTRDTLGVGQVDNSINIEVTVPPGETEDYGRRVGRAVAEEIRMQGRGRNYGV